MSTALVSKKSPKLFIIINWYGKVVGLEWIAMSLCYNIKAICKYQLLVLNDTDLYTLLKIEYQQVQSRKY